MADGKWISELTAATPLADATRRVLSVRLAVVRDYLPLAMRQADEDIEYVHHLRVGTRRAAAALEIFALCLPSREYRTARKTLRRIRRAAGAARDWDVFLASLQAGEEVSTRAQPGRDLVIGCALAQRVAAQDLLAEASPNYPFDFERFLAETVAAVHKPHGHADQRTLLDLAKPMLSQLVRELHEAAAGDLTDYDHLHQVRIIGKRLRYAMEVFVDCFAPPFREQLYPSVEEMQEILGEANDSHVAAQRYTLLGDRVKVLRPDDWRRFRTGIDRLRQYHEQRVEAQRHKFIEWWAGWQRSGGEAVFEGLLKPANASNGTSVAEEPATASVTDNGEKETRDGM